MPNSRLQDGWLAGPAEARADDIHAAFADPRVSVVLVGIGGNHSNQLLPLLDYDLIRANPKVFQGYSDITVLHWAFQKHADLATFYGPAFAIELADYPKVSDYTQRWLRAAWFRDEALEYEPAAEWTDEFLDFDHRLDLTRGRAMKPGDGWVTVREGACRGPIIGGCLETICWHLKGSDAWLDPTGAILFLETSEEAPSPAHVEAYLTDLDHLGVFERCVGLLWARPDRYSPDDVGLLWDVVRSATEPYGLPVLANIDCGHAYPMMTLPLGVPAEMDAGNHELKVVL